MSHLLDTKVVSELARPKPERAVADWFAEVADEALFLSVLTLGELRTGTESLPKGRNGSASDSGWRRIGRRGAVGDCWRWMRRWRIGGAGRWRVRS